MDIFLVSLLSYLSGSIPFGLILGKIFSKVDIRKIGSGNIDATNVLSTANTYLVLITLLIKLFLNQLLKVIKNYRHLFNQALAIFFLILKCL